MLSKNEIKLIKSLGNNKYRKKHGLFVVEGERLVKEALLVDTSVDQVFFSESYLSNPANTLANIVTKKNIPTKLIPDNHMKTISDTVSPSGVLTLCKIPEQPTLESVVDQNMLYLDTIQDPGNLGTLLRSASWFGVKHVVLSKNCIDVYNPKVVRSGMGAHFSLDIFYNISLNIFNKHIKIGGFQEGESIYNISKKSIQPWILVIGNEAHGITPSNTKLINIKITIPKIGNGDSLNAAVAGSILLYHLTDPS